MILKCDNCQASNGEGASECTNCGAPILATSAGDVSTVAPDFRFCPHCNRRLLALGSPACNYCGRPLPEDFQKARSAMWERLQSVSEGRASDEEIEQLEREGDEDLRRAVRALRKLQDPSGQK